MEVIVVMMLVVIAIELLLILIRFADEDDPERYGIKEKEHASRREIQGTFANPLGDSYRKNKGLYVPIVPGSKMLDGDEDDEV